MRTILLFLSLILAIPSICFGWGSNPPFMMGPVISSVEINEAFEFVMRTSGATETVTLPFNAYTDIDIDWGDGGSVENFTTGTVSHEYATADDYSISITGSATAFSFSNGGDRLKLISVSNLGDLGWTSFYSAFYGCSNMTSFDAGYTDTSSVTTMFSMFRSCSSLTSLDLGDLFDTSLVTAMYGVFYECSSLTSLDLGDLFDTSLVTTMNVMFYNSSSLASLDLGDLFDTSLVTTMDSMFRGCSSLASLDLGDLFDTSLVTTMYGMFYNCSSLDLDISGFDIASLTSANSMMDSTGFSNTNYDLMLVAWEAQTELADVPFHAGAAAKYGPGSPATARAALVSSGWTITDGGAQ